MTKALHRIFGAAGLLVLVLAVLLCAQWPLRDWLQAGSRLANDMAQAVFAVYVAVAVTAASRAGTHLAAHSATHTGAAGGNALRGWRRWALLACVAPWAGFVLWTAAPLAWNSVLQAERFPDSGSPGYFVLKLALCLLALLVLVDATARKPTTP